MLESKNKKIRKVFYIAIFLFVIFFIIYILFLISYYWSPIISMQIDPLSFIGILVNIILVVFVVNNISKKTEESRIEKNLLIKRVEGFEESLVKVINNFLTVDELSIITVNSEIQILRKIIHSLKDLLISRSIIKKDSKIILEIDSHIRDLADLITDSNDDCVSILDGRILFNNSSKNTIFIKKNELRNKLFELIVYINNCDK